MVERDRKRKRGAWTLSAIIVVEQKKDSFSHEIVSGERETGYDGDMSERTSFPFCSSSTYSVRLFKLHVSAYSQSLAFSSVFLNW